MKAWLAVIGVIVLMVIIYSLDIAFKSMGSGFAMGMKFAGFLIGAFVIFVLYEMIKNKS